MKSYSNKDAKKLIIHIIRNTIIFFCIFHLEAQSAYASPAQSASFDGSVLSDHESRYRPVVSVGGMVSSDDEAASRWGVDVLKQGGNAVDAAVATAFYLSVSRPHYASLGGGGFLIFCPAPKKSVSSNLEKRPSCSVIDYREVAPLAARKNMFIKNGKANTDLSQNGALASAVPGVTAGLLLALKKWGTISRQQILSRPIQVAENGISWSSHSESAASERWDAFNEEAKKLFGCTTAQGHWSPCRPGARVKQKDLARVLRAISKKGVSGFYSGWVSKNIARSIQKSGGIISLEDMSQYQSKLREPLYGKYQNFEIVTMPPPSSGGIILLQLFKYAELAEKGHYLSSDMPSADSIHVFSHAMGLAFADRAFYYGDPDFVTIPIQNLLSEEYLSARWKNFNPASVSLPKAHGVVTPEGDHTTHFSVIDKAGNAVSVTTTVNDFFGSGFVPEGTGIVLNNEMDDFSLEPGVPNLYGLVGAEANSIAPQKRPLSSMSPTIVRDEQGMPTIVMGAQGGPKIPTSVFLSLMNRLRYGLSLPDAVIAPRFHHQWRPEELQLEKNSYSEETKNKLKAIGYVLKEKNSSGIIHALERFSNGRVWGVSDPRSEGMAVGE